MPHHLVQKTFKMELEFTVTMDELGEEHLGSSDICCTLPLLKQLQQALVKHEPALIRQMLAGAVSKLQEYADYLASQNTVETLKQVVATLEPEEQEYFAEAGDQFSDLANARKPLNEYRGLHNLFCKVGYGDIVDNLTPRYLQKRSWGE